MCSLLIRSPMVYPVRLGLLAHNPLAYNPTQSGLTQSGRHSGTESLPLSNARTETLAIPNCFHGSV